MTPGSSIDDGFALSSHKCGGGLVLEPHIYPTVVLLPRVVLVSDGFKACRVMGQLSLV